MLTKRIIPCLDVKSKTVVKGERFTNLKTAGDPIELARKYYKQGADEIAFLDISASCQGRGTKIRLVKNVASEIFIPLTVGGGVRSLNDIELLLRSGADKVSINTAAVKNPSLIKKASQKFGSQCIVLAIDAKRKNKDWKVFTKGGKKETGKKAINWAKKAEQLGAGEILLTSIDKDGTKKGYDLGLTRKVSKAVGIPVIASGGAGEPADILDILKSGNADAALAASIFHYKERTVKDVKKYLYKKGIEVRL